MKIKTKIENEKEEKEETERNPRVVSMNGVSGFWKHPRYENCWIYNGRMPTSNCWIYINDNDVQILNVMVYNPEDRKCGFGSQMISDIRLAFQQMHIWVDTWNCSRPFWQKMKQRGMINSIANDYSWPCANTTCTTCHKDRPDYSRRSRFD